MFKNLKSVWFMVAIGFIFIFSLLCINCDTSVSVSELSEEIVSFDSLEFTVIFPPQPFSLVLRIMQSDSTMPSGWLFIHKTSETSYTFHIATYHDVPFTFSYLADATYPTTDFSICDDCELFYTDSIVTNLRCKGEIQYGDTIRFFQ